MNWKTDDKERFFKKHFLRYSHVRKFVVAETPKKGLTVIWHEPSMWWATFDETYLYALHTLEQTPENDGILEKMIRNV